MIDALYSNVDVGGFKWDVESSNQDSDNICMPLLDDSFNTSATYNMQ